MLTWGIRHLVKSKLMSLSEAWEMASMRPASFIGLPCEAGLKVGAPANLIAFTSNEDGIDIIETYKNGEIVYSKSQNKLVV